MTPPLPNTDELKEKLVGADDTFQGDSLEQAKIETQYPNTIAESEQLTSENLPEDEKLYTTILDFFESGLDRPIVVENAGGKFKPGYVLQFQDILSAVQNLRTDLVFPVRLRGTDLTHAIISNSNLHISTKVVSDQFEHDSGKVATYQIDPYDSRLSNQEWLQLLHLSVLGSVVYGFKHNGIRNGMDKPPKGIAIQTFFADDVEFRIHNMENEIEAFNNNLRSERPAIATENQIFNFTNRHIAAFPEVGYQQTVFMLSRLSHSRLDFSDAEMQVYFRYFQPENPRFQQRTAVMERITKIVESRVLGDMPRSDPNLSRRISLECLELYLSLSATALILREMQKMAEGDRAVKPLNG